MCCTFNDVQGQKKKKKSVSIIFIYSYFQNGVPTLVHGQISSVYLVSYVQLFSKCGQSDLLFTCCLYQQVQQIYIQLREYVPSCIGSVDSEVNETDDFPPSPPPLSFFLLVFFSFIVRSKFADEDTVSPHSFVQYT